MMLKGGRVNEVQLELYSKKNGLPNTGCFFTLHTYSVPKTQKFPGSLFLYSKDCSS